MLHVLKHPRQLTQGDFPVDEVAGADLAAGDGIECLADEVRCMVEGGLDGDLRVVQRRGQPPNRLTVPPRRTIWMAHSQVTGEPTASTTESAPRPPSVSSSTRRTGSSSWVTSKAARAPRRSAARTWLARFPSAIT